MSGELTTPTGAALATTLSAGFGALPAMSISTIGYGAGDHDFKGHANVLRVLVDTIRVVAVMLQPFMPTSIGKMLDQLGVPAEGRGFDSLSNALPDGIQLPPPQGVFPRYVEPAA